MRNGRLNSVEDLRALDVEHSSLPKSWHDMTHDLEGIRQFQVSGGILLWIFMTVTTVAALITIFVGGDRVLVFWLSIAAIIPLGIQLGDISEVLSAWCVASARSVGEAPRFPLSSPSPAAFAAACSSL